MELEQWIYSIHAHTKKQTVLKIIMLSETYPIQKDKPYFSPMQNLDLNLYV